MASKELIKPLQSDPYFRVMFYSPWQEEYFQQGVGMNIPGLSFFPLVLLGVASFIVNRSAWRWRRALICGSSCWQVITLELSHSLPWLRHRSPP